MGIFRYHPHIGHFHMSTLLQVTRHSHTATLWKEDLQNYNLQKRKEGELICSLPLVSALLSFPCVFKVTSEKYRKILFYSKKSSVVLQSFRGKKKLGCTQVTVENHKTSQNIPLTASSVEARVHIAGPLECGRTYCSWMISILIFWQKPTHQILCQW